MTEIRVPKKIVNAPYWSLGDHFLRFDEAQGLTPEQILEIFSTLGLGSMAIRDEGAGPDQFRTNQENDGRFMQPGAFGLGSGALEDSSVSDVNAETIARMWARWTASNQPRGETGWSYINLPRGSSSMAQIAIRSNTGEPEPQMDIRHQTGPNTYTPWRPVTPERGSNASGEYVRFADGTQVCWRAVDHDLSPAGYQDWEYPANFIDTPVGAHSVSGAGAAAPRNWLDVSKGSAWADDSGRWRTRNNFGTTGTSGATGTVPIQLIAIGRWF